MNVCMERNTLDAPSKQHRELRTFRYGVKDSGKDEIQDTPRPAGNACAVCKSGHIY